MKKKLLLLIISLVGMHIVVQAQSSFGIFAEGGASRIKILGYENTEPTLRVTTNYISSAKAGFYYECLLKNKFIIGSKLLATTVGTKADFYWTWDAQGTPAQSWQEGTVEGRLLGFGLVPLYVGYKYKMFSFNVGIQGIVFPLYSYYDKYTEYYYGGNNGTTLIQNTYEEKEKGSVGGFIYDLGFTTNIAYHINRRFTAEASCYYDLRNSFTSNEGDLKLRQLTIGLKYSILVSKKK